MRLTSETKARIVGISVVIVWLLVWEWSVRFQLLNPSWFFSPSATLHALYQSLLVTGELRTHMWATVTRLVGGLMIGALPALWLGFVMGRNKWARLRYGPILAVVGLIPVLATLPTYIIVFGLGDLGKWVAVSAAVFYPILHCTTIGVGSSRAVQHAGSSPASSANRTDWPYGAGPWIFTGLKLGVVIGLAALLGAEMFASTSGLEFVIITAGTRLDFARYYAGMFAAALVVYALWLCLSAIELALSRSISAKSSAGGDLQAS